MTEITEKTKTKNTEKPASKMGLKLFACPICKATTPNGTLHSNGWYYAICAACNIAYPAQPDEILWKQYPHHFHKPIARPKITTWI